MLMHRRERRETKTTADFLQTWRVAVLLDELLKIVENLALTFGKWLHTATLCKGKAKVNGCVTSSASAKIQWT